MGRLSAKRNLTNRELYIVESEYDRKRKESWLAYVLWFFTGGIGGHRYYLGDYWYAAAMTLTLGGFGLWTLVDLFLIGRRVDSKNEEIESKIIDETTFYRI